MPCRLFAAVLAFIALALAIPASALSPGRFSDPAVVAAAARLKLKDYRGAREAALKASDPGVRSFLVGMTDVKLEFYEDAAPQLAAAAQYLPLLGDYALYNQGLALSKLSRTDEALAPLQKLVKTFPGSRLVRPSLFLSAETLFSCGRYKEALDAYSAFVERYPLGSDSLKALHASALCREKLGDPAGAAAILRGIWIRNPGSGVAQQAADEMSQLAKTGVAIAPYTVDELFRRASALYDLGQYGKAAAAFSEIASRAESGEFAARVRLKLGLSHFKARHYHDAEETLRPLAERPGSTEGAYWYARALEKSGNPEKAYTRYLALSERGVGGNLAADALLDAAYLKRYQGHTAEALRLFQNFLNRYPDAAKRPAILWEVAWLSYQSRDYRSAVDYLQNLSQYREQREKSLYWLGRALILSGDQKGGEAQMAVLCSDYPFGYYAMLCNSGRPSAEPPRPPQNLAGALPMPAGLEREKALIALGLYEEATRELSLIKKPKNPFSVARLYLEMENYNAAYHLTGQDVPKAGDPDGSLLWGVNFPLAFRQEVAKEAAASNVPESLVYAVIRAESNYLPSALSPVGAVGLMQIMPATAESIAKGGSARLTSPDLNIRLGARHLKDLLESFSGNIPLSIAAYNAGGGNARRWQRNFGTLPLDEFVESITFKETREYVKKVTSAMALYQSLYALPAVSPLTRELRLTAH
ncbi:transglycosylase SLT domain-containing protein [Geomonas sp. RF6]|uniref:transglycosylase SLT domain-containing protein n=1 Tax=Geomonas sp. RF6 TaxID=2897342 RepID=UPI001E4A763A|nr:transglycosylase SLT domain-containing protein [Geomonas sp. RF6]UFS69699.1 transglycosylase SLT domain-containing protein [Geomonas sp. RF6]